MLYARPTASKRPRERPMSQARLPPPRPACHPAPVDPWASDFSKLGRRGPRRSTAGRRRLDSSRRDGTGISCRTFLPTAPATDVIKGDAGPHHQKDLRTRHLMISPCDPLSRSFRKGGLRTTITVPCPRPGRILHRSPAGDPAAALGKKAGVIAQSGHSRIGRNRIRSFDPDRSGGLVMSVAPITGFGGPSLSFPSAPGQDQRF